MITNARPTRPTRASPSPSRVRLERLGKRRCRTCGHRRIAFALRGYAGPVVIASSPVLCAACAGLH